MGVAQVGRATGSRALHLITTQTAADQASGELNTRFQGPLMSYFQRQVKDKHLAEDLTQEVLLRVVRASRLKKIEHAEGYIFQVAANLLKDHWRQVRRTTPATHVPIEEALAGELESQLVEDLSPERVLLIEESLSNALRTLGELGELTRNIFILFRLENMKHKEIAALYGIGRSTVEKHVMKAVLHLANRYGRKP
jgi:RNA polymerase sigma-70 factor (ECF subfamily)